ncbi:MAG: AMP-binding protein, partial [Halobacteriales archaeon]|nr:AMP-binding protein [Halobacteriales archaeon]
MLEGFTPWPDHLVDRYRERGYWRDEPLGEYFAACVEAYGDRTAMVFEDQTVSYRELGDRVEELARSFLGHGIGLYDRVVVQLQNHPDFVYTYFGLVTAGAIPVLALPPHRQREIGHFIEKTEAVAYVVPDEFNGFDYVEMAQDMVEAQDDLEHVFVSGETPDRFVALADLDGSEASRAELDDRIGRIDPMEPAIFQLSGGTTGIPKIIPRTHNDYVYNSIGFAEVHGMSESSSLLVVLPIAHNFALASPGIQGVLFNGGRIVLSESTRPDEAFPLIDRHAVTHIELVPALLIKWLEDGPFSAYDVSSVEVVNTGGQRLQPEVYRRADSAFPNATIQEVFGMAEGLLCSPHLDDPE